MLDEEDDEEIEKIFGALGLVSPDMVMKHLGKSWRKEHENQPISLNTTISAGLNKCPFQWINGICKTLGIPTKGKKKDKVAQISSKLTTQLAEVVEKIPQEPINALRLVIEAGGWIRYNQLSKKYGSEENDSYWWENDPPKSAIGILRLHALLFIENMVRIATPSWPK